MKTKRFAALLFTLLLALSFISPVFAEGEEDGGLSSQSIVEDYSVNAPNGTLIKGATAVIAVKVRNPLLLTADGKNIDVTRTSDSFKGGSVSVQVTSADDKPLEYVVTFTDVQYTGKGNSLNSFVLYRDCDLPVEPLNVTVEECVEYAEPTADPKPLPVPELQINRGEMEQPVKAGESFQVSVIIANASAAAANGVVAVFEPGEGLTLEENKISKSLGTIPANGATAVTVALKAADPLETASLTLGVSLKYIYAAAEGTAEGAAEDKLLIPAAVSRTSAARVNSATPNIIVTQYSCGKASVAAGEKFKLRVSFCNTSKTTAVDNIVMTVDTGESLSITSASNTYYYAALKPNETKTQVIEMQVPANAAVTGAKAEISFRYEYVSGGERTAASSSENLSVPVYLPDRFSLTEPEPITAEQGVEWNLSIPYVNRGKGEISNVEAKLTFAAPEDAACEQPNLLLGNIEAGKSGTIDFFFTPQTAGELKMSVIVSYEDEMTEPKTVTLPLTVTVEEAMAEEDPMPDDGGMEELDGHTLPKAAIIAAAIGAPALVGVVVFAVIKRKKKKQAADVLPEGFDWGDGEASEQEPKE